MSRDIKFRAWDKEFKRFSESPLKYPVEDINYHTDYIWMQYTGLTDKKGVEIYEGDILKCHHQTNGFVFYLDGSYHVSSDQVELDYENHTTYDHLNSDLIMDNNLEVVGNIYESEEKS